MSKGKLAFIGPVFLMVVVLLSLSSGLAAAQYPPQVPSSFYGEVQIVGYAHASGDAINAYIDAVSPTSPVATATIKGAGSSWVYTMDVPQDSASSGSTPNGGSEGDTIYFRLSSDATHRVLAIGTWHGGTNTALPLHPPAPSITVPASPVWGTPITLGSDVQDLGGTTHITYAWTVTRKDGSEGPVTGTNASIDFTASKPGEYTATLTATDEQGGVGSATQEITVGKKQATLTFVTSDLSQTYNGNPKSVGVTTTPEGLEGVVVTYKQDGNPVASPTNAGTYAVEASLTNDDYEGSLSGTLVIAKATATLALSDLSYTYDGNAKSVTVTTVPPSLAGVGVTYSLNDVPVTNPTNAGSYAVDASLTNDNYQANSVHGELVIAKATTTLALSDLSYTYDGNAKAVTVTTDPVGLSGVAVHYSQGGNPVDSPINAGSYAVEVSFTNDNYQADSVNGTLMIGKATATLTLVTADLSQTYDGNPKSVKVTTTPAGLNGVTVSYSQNGVAVTDPTNAGSYAVDASLDNPNYEPATASGTLAIARAAQVITFGALADKTYGDASFDVSATGGGSGNPVTFGVTGACSLVAGKTVQITGAGSCTVTADQADSANYEAAPAVPQTFHIAKATATLTLVTADLSQTYDGNPKSVKVTTDPADLTVVTVSYSQNGVTVDSPTAAGSYAVEASLDNPNYEGSASGTLVIAKATATLTLVTLDLSQTYDGNPKSVGVTTTPDGLSGVVVSYSQGGTPVTSPTNAGSYAVGASLHNDNYELATANGTLVIAKATATLTLVTADLSQTYDGNPKSVRVTTTPAGLNGVTVSYSQGGTPVTSPTNAGSYAVDASLDNLNYAAVSVNGTLAIAKATQTITFGALADKTYGDASFDVSATGGGSGNPVTFGVTGACSLAAGKTVQITGAGSCTVTADQADSANYEAAPAVPQTFHIAKAKATLTLSDLSQTYDGNPKSVKVTTAPADLTVVTVSYSQNGVTVDSPTAAGSYAVDASLDNPNYEGSVNGTLAIAQATQTITFGALANKTYGDASFDVSATGGGSNNPVTFGVTGACSLADGKTVQIMGAGSCTVTADQAGNANYEAAPAVPQTFDISKRSIEVTAESGRSKKYGDEDPAALAYAITNGSLVGTDAFTGALSRTAGKNVGSYPIEQGTLSAGPNYVLSFKGASFVISPRPLTVSATGINKVHDGTTVAAVTLKDDRVTGDNDLTVGYESAAFSDANVGKDKTVSVSGISITAGNEAGNYTLANSTTTTTANITAYLLTVHATAANKIYDGTTAAVVTLTDDRVAGDSDLTVTFTKAEFDTKNVGTGKTVSVSGIAISGESADNYTLASATAGATADITARTLAVSATGIDKVYDGSALAMISLPDDRVQDDVLTVSYGSAAFSDKNVGTDKAVSVSGLAISGTDAGNYTLAGTTAGTTAAITARTLTVSATGVNKIYDGTTAATVTLADDRVTDDVLTVGYGSAAFSDKNVGTGKTVSVSGIAISGTDAGNYTLAGATAGTTAAITARTLTVSATGIDKIYDGTTAATANLSSDKVGGDEVSLSYGSAAFSDKNVGPGKAVSVSGLAISGTDAGNYTLVSDAASATAAITARTLTVSATGIDKVYDGSALATISLPDDRVAGDNDLTVSYQSAAFSDKNVGTGKTVSVSGIAISGTDAGNYTLASTTANATAAITARSLTVGATGIDKVYDGTANATVTLADDRVAGDVLTVGYESAAFSDKNVGTGKTVSVSGIAISGTDAGNYAANTTAGTTAAITRAVPVITWNNPADIVSGTPLGDGQLNATASTAGSFVYTPAAGVVLLPGQGQVLAAAFTPDDTGNFESVTTRVTINVTPLQHAITLHPGWNLVSFYLVPVDTKWTSVLASVAGHYDLVYAWDAQNNTWLRGDNLPQGQSTLATLDQKMGFWIHITGTEDRVLTVEGSMPSAADATINLVHGWNLVGYPSVSSVAMPNAMENHGVANGSYDLVYAYHGDSTGWQIFVPSPAPSWISSLKQVDPGWAYWIQLPDSSTGAAWQVPQ